MFHIRNYVFTMNILLCRSRQPSLTKELTKFQNISYNIIIVHVNIMQIVRSCIIQILLCSCLLNFTFYNLFISQSLLYWKIWTNCRIGVRALISGWNFVDAGDKKRKIFWNFEEEATSFSVLRRGGGKGAAMNLNS